MGMENALITGISGFIGSNLAKRLQNKCNVVGIVRDFVPKNPLKLLGVEEVTLVRGDVRNFRLLTRVLSTYDIDTVFHLAAQSEVKKALKDPISTFESNVMGTVNVLEACRIIGGVERILFTSTDKIYGEGLSASEDDPLRPKEIYGASKACGDIIAQTYIEAYGLAIFITRACNVYGPGDLHSRIIPNTIRACLKGESPIIFENYKGVREYLYVDDLIDAFLMLIEDPLLSGGVCNIGSGEVKGQEEVVLEILKHFPNLKPEYVDYPGKVTEIEEQSLNTRRIRMLGWEPRVSFEEGIRRTVEWWKGL